MAVRVMNSYNGYAARNAAGMARKKDAEQAVEKAGSRPETTADYVRELEKLVPSVELRVGNTFASAKTGKTLTINPGILNKMRNDPEQEKETKELIKGVEFMTRMMDSFYKATGRKLVYRHSYIDENGKYYSYAYVKKEDKLSPKLREERRKATERLIEKTREKTAKNKAELQKALEQKKAGKRDPVEERIRKKIAASGDGMIYLNDTDFRALIRSAKGENGNRAGANLDLQA